jgi:hypothetical protein
MEMDRVMIVKRLEDGLEPVAEIGTYTNGHYKGKLDIGPVLEVPSINCYNAQLVLSLVDE